MQALAWIAGREDLLPAYLGASGVDPATLSRRAADPELLAGVLDFLLGEDAWVIGFAAVAGIRPEEVARARRALPGGEAIDWI